MLIVISNPVSIDGEAEIINELFASGMSLFHLRKLTYSDIEMMDLLLEIDSKYHSKIALHTYHELADEFDIKRLHFKEENRNKVSEETLKKYKEKQFILSSSIHDLTDYEGISENFDYVFCSPVFDSISKEFYKAKEFDLGLLDKKRVTKLIALAGVDKTNIQKAFDLGFDGVAVLGAIWMSEDPIKEFQILNKTWLTSVQ